MKKKRKILGLASLLTVVALFVAFTTKSNAENIAFGVEVSSETVEKGAEFPITIHVTGSNLMKSIDAYVSYDNDILEYVSSESDAVTGSTGVLKIVDNFEDGGIDQVSYTLNFRALEVGSSQFKVQEMHVEEESNHDVSLVDDSAATIRVKESASESKDAYLESLEVFPEGLQPEFEKTTDSYTVDVDADTSELIISAIPSDKDSVVTVSGNENFKAGKNIVTILVTSPSGNSVEYKITVNR